MLFILPLAEVNHHINSCYLFSASKKTWWCAKIQYPVLRINFKKILIIKYRYARNENK